MFLLGACTETAILSLMHNGQFTVSLILCLHNVSLIFHKGSQFCALIAFSIRGEGTAFVPFFLEEREKQRGQ